MSALVFVDTNVVVYRFDRTEAEKQQRDPVVLDQGVLERAWQLEDRWSLAWWDSLIVAAAFTSGATYLLSEDFQRGQDFGGIEVVDPFSVAPETVLPAS